MTIPDKIILLGEVFEIIQTTKEDLVCKECDDKCVGKIVWEEKKIYVAVDDEENSVLEILLHELGHYYSEYYGLGKSEAWAEAFGKFVKSIIEQLG